jgi:hypothetical protein
VSLAPGQRLEGADDNLFDAVVAHGAWDSAAGLIEQAVEPMLDEPSPPLADGLGGDMLFGGDGAVVRHIGAGQHDAGAKSRPLRDLAPASQAYQVLPFVVTQRQLQLRAAANGAVSARHERPTRHPPSH